MIEQAAREAYNAAWQVYKRHLNDPEARALYEEAVERWHTALSVLYSPGFLEACDLVRGGDPAGLEPVIAFLEEDSHCFRSGYIKADLVRFITRLDLSPEHAARLRNVVLQIVDRRDGREFRHYCRLARKVRTPEFQEELSKRLLCRDPNVRRRARWVLQACEHPG
jgi:hypothetical protein